MHVVAFLPPVRIAVAVVVVHAEPEHQAAATPEACGKLFILEQGSNRIGGLFDGDDRAPVLIDVPDREQPVAGGAEYRGGHVELPFPFFYLAPEKLIEGANVISFIVVHVYLVFSDEALYQECGEAGIQKSPACPGEGRGSEKLEQGPSGNGLIEKRQGIHLLLLPPHDDEDICEDSRLYNPDSDEEQNAPCRRLLDLNLRDEKKTYDC